MRELKEHSVMDHRVLRWKGNSRSPCLPWRGDLLQCPWQLVNQVLLLRPVVTDTHSFPEQRVLCDSMESAQFLLNRSPCDSHPLLLASKATCRKFTLFPMTTLWVFEHNNLVPLQTSLLLVMHPQFRQKLKNLAILEYLFRCQVVCIQGFI